MTHAEVSSLSDSATFTWAVLGSQTVTFNDRSSVLSAPIEY